MTKIASMENVCVAWTFSIYTLDQQHNERTYNISISIPSVRLYFKTNNSCCRIYVIDNFFNKIFQCTSIGFDKIVDDLEGPLSALIICSILINNRIALFYIKFYSFVSLILQSLNSFMARACMFLLLLFVFFTPFVLPIRTY